MEWNQLEYFQTLARIQHFTQAAKMLHITQPALSRSIAKLEEEVGVPLFERQGRTVCLNRYGEMFLKRIEVAITEVEKGKQELLEELNPVSGTISLAFLHIIGTQMVPRILSEFGKKYPHVEFELSQFSNDVAMQKLEQGKCDFFITSSVTLKDGIRKLDLLTEELFVAVPTGHHLSQNKEVDLFQIIDEPFIGIKSHCGLRDTLDLYFEKIGFTPKTKFEGEEVMTVAGLVSAGLGVSILPAAPALQLDGISWVKLRNPSCTRNIGIAWSENHYMSPSAQLFRNFIVKQYADKTVKTS
ncbi:LysR family transcriptional regulator [Priestia megaterium]|uniref:LysR family transcriptional regulator n=1 Tax=Priestia megaterium TaxID=1404 RepID=UPI0021ACBC65|nr:LysR family transcriptional regulator [Priestia megaterium]MCR8928883.1 LysR family transcriptional regulator [Priestia megaterium]